MANMEIKRFKERHPNGDRDLNRHDSYRFEISLDGFVVKTFDQFDLWTCSIKDYQRTVNAAMKYAIGLAESLHIQVPEVVRMTKKVTTTYEWVEEENPNGYDNP